MHGTSPGAHWCKVLIPPRAAFFLNVHDFLCFFCGVTAHECLSSLFLVSYRRQRAGIELNMIDFPSFGKKQPEPERKMPWGDENPYRIFGIVDDAPYEEVEAAYQALVEENKDNEKYCMQLEMMKEKIFDDRLPSREPPCWPHRFLVICLLLPLLGEQQSLSIIFNLLMHVLCVYNYTCLVCVCVCVSLTDAHQNVQNILKP